MRLPLKRAHKAARAALLALSFVAISNAHAANDWVNFGTVSMTNATTPKLTNNYLCYTDGKDIACDTSVGPVYVGTAGIINNGGMTVAGSVSASAVSATYVSGTVIQVNTSAMPCSTGLAGAIRYNSGNIEYCNGSAWGQLANGSGGTLSGGSATAIAFWSGPTTLTYESATTTGLYWDHVNGRLGVGTTTPTLALTVDARNNVDGLLVRGSNAPYIQVSNTGGLGLGQIGIATQANQFGLGTSVGDFSIGSLNGNLFLTGRGAATSAIIMGTGPSSNQERMRIDVNGNVGVNTQSPTATLQVSGTFTVSNSTNPNSPSLYVPSNGSVGVFTTTPAPNALDVSGDIRVSNGGGATEKALFMRFNPALNSGVLGTYDWNAGSYLNTIIWAGNLAIGTGGTYPSSLTVANGEIQTASSGAACVSATNGGAIRYSAGTLYYCNGSNTWSTISGGGAGFTGGGSATAIAFWNGANSLTYENSGTTSLYWDHINGRLGVNTSIPSTSLHVGSSGASIRLNTNVSNSGVYGYNDGSGNLIMAMTRQQLTSGNTADMLFSAYNGIGFQPAATSGVDGTAMSMYLTKTGLLGVGMITPTATLQVSGTMIVSSTGQNTASAASLLVDSRGVSVSSIVHITGSAFSPIGAGGNAILSGTTAVSTSSAGSITMYAGGAQRAYIDSANVSLAVPLLISTSSVPALKIYNGNGAQRISAKLQSGVGYIYAYDDVSSSNAPLVLGGTGGLGSGIMVDASGNVGIGTTPSGGYAVDVLSNTSHMAWRFMNSGTGGGQGGMVVDLSNAVSGNWFVSYAKNGTSVGTVTYNGSGVAYNTTSDRRVKENITDTREGLQKLMQINVKDFSFKADPSHTIVNGFIAQDLDKVYPEAVTTNGDNGEVPLKDTKHIWQVDYGRVTPLIVKAVQDLKHLFDSDKAETDAKLKAANDNIQTLGKQVEALREEVMQLKQGQQ